MPYRELGDELGERKQSTDMQQQLGRRLLGSGGRRGGGRRSRGSRLAGRGGFKNMFKPPKRNTAPKRDTTQAGYGRIFKTMGKHLKQQKIAWAAIQDNSDGLIRDAIAKLRFELSNGVLRKSKWELGQALPTGKKGVEWHLWRQNAWTCMAKGTMAALKKVCPISTLRKARFERSRYHHWQGGAWNCAARSASAECSLQHEQ